MRPRVLLTAALFLATLSILRVNAQSTESEVAAVSPTPTAATVSPNDSQQTPTSAPVEKSAQSDVDADSAKDTQAPEKRKWHLRFGGLAVGAGYSHFSGPYFYPYAYPFTPWGFYPGDWVTASAWYSFWAPYPYYGPGSFAYNNGRGEIRLTAEPRAAEVYIDGGYAGTADKLKSLWLDPGAYDLTVSYAGRESFHQRLYVLSGKSLKITAKLNPDEGKEKP